MASVDATPVQHLGIGGLIGGWHSVGIWVQDKVGNALSLPTRRNFEVRCNDGTGPGRHSVPNQHGAALAGGLVASASRGREVRERVGAASAPGSGGGEVRQKAPP